MRTQNKVYASLHIIYFKHKLKKFVSVYLLLVLIIFMSLEIAFILMKAAECQIEYNVYVAVKNAFICAVDWINIYCYGMYEETKTYNATEPFM